MPTLTTPVHAGRFHFELATAADEPALREFARGAEMPGTIRFVFEREPDYFEALHVEGRESEVLICREAETGRVVATGHRSIKPLFVNGRVKQAGYLSGLRIDGSARNGRILAHGYAFLRECHDDQRAPFYLTTIMEDNDPAKAVLLSGRAGLPRYHDFGRFCCMAVGMRIGPRRPSGAGIRVRCACATDEPAIIEYLHREGRSRQFFPKYQPEDFGMPGGLLSHLAWGDVFLAFHGDDLAGVVAAWDQRPIRQWRITGYADWLHWLRTPFNLVSNLKGMPSLPKPGAPLDYCILSLVCIRHDDRKVFAMLLDEIIREQPQRYAFLLAGLHERDPLFPELLSRPHFPLPSRLYVVAWEDGEEAVRTLDRRLVPYLELGSL